MSVLSAVLQLIEVLNDDERLTVIRRLRPEGTALAIRGDVSSHVAEVIRVGQDYRVDEITEAVRGTCPDVTQKQVYNALSYLTRHGGVRRIRYGVYRATKLQQACGRAPTHPDREGKGGERP